MSFTKRFFLVLLLIVAGALVYLLIAPVPINPAAWTPPAAPALAGQYEKNNRLAPTERLPLGDGHGPEDVALAGDSKIYAGFDDGRIMQLQADGTKPQVFANTEGRPLGLIFDANDNLIIADAVKGLLQIDQSGKISTLVDQVNGVRFGCLNDLDVGKDGTIYFTEASNKFPMTQFTEDLIEHQPNGRLLAFDPKTHQTRTLLPEIHFANGVAVSPDQNSVLVNETGMYRVLRYWLRGEKAGKSEVFIDNLPGFPDGISSNGKDKYWLSLVTPRDSFFDRILPHPFLRKMVMRLPKFLRPAPQRYSFVLGLSVDGRVIDNLQNGAPGCYAEIANTVERNGSLYFGSIAENSVGRFKLKLK
ncbi:MAG TPA: SMP-30/gluconolactonase/LRE family protein [Pyrinomonadaceae bacterium]|nr:SMP-30/gluconolactonase/LRE family protein [Pyrinomonadaceae bacterium]